jgi:hypothetical protein
MVTPVRLQIQADLHLKENISLKHVCARACVYCTLISVPKIWLEIPQWFYLMRHSKIHNVTALFCMLHCTFMHVIIKLALSVHSWVLHSRNLSVMFSFRNVWNCGKMKMQTTKSVNCKLWPSYMAEEFPEHTLSHAETHVGLHIKCPMLLLSHLTKIRMWQQILVKVPNVKIHKTSAVEALHANRSTARQRGWS